MELNLTGKVAIVTGASRGLGNAIARGLAAEGVKVAVNYLNSRKKAEALAEEMRTTLGTAAVAVQGDVAKLDDIRRFFDVTEAELGPVDILVNNAGTWPTCAIKDITERQWNETQQVILTGPFLACREAIRRWIDGPAIDESAIDESGKARPGRIVNITSPTAFFGSSNGHADYAAAKAGLVTFTVSLAREVSRYGIVANCVAPGFIVTDMARQTLEDHRQKYLDRIPLGRFGEPHEVAKAVVFLASDAASYTTGATLDVTGGLLMR